MTESFLQKTVVKEERGMYYMHQEILQERDSVPSRIHSHDLAVNE
jgi:hypothetical protein